MIQITCKRKTGFYRCGKFHPGKPIDYADDFWTKEQLKALRAEPMLIVLSVSEDKKTGKGAPSPQPSPPAGGDGGSGK